LASHPRLEVYFRPGGRVSAGYASSAGLRQLAGIAADGRLPDFRPGWFVAVRRGVVAAVNEDSVIRSSSKGVRHLLACVYGARTQAFVK